MYHRLGSPLVRSIVRGQYVFAWSLYWQIRQLQTDGYRGITMRELLSRPECATDHFAITFDDGYRGVWTKAFPVLTALNTPATIYMVADAIGGTNIWDQRIGDRVEPMLGLDELRAMAQAGIEIGAHSVHHAHLCALSDIELQRELVDGKQRLEDAIGQTVVSFAYPYGEWDARIRQAVINAGYQSAVITDRGAYSPQLDPYAIYRVQMRFNTLGFMLTDKLRSANEITARAEMRPAG